MRTTTSLVGYSGFVGSNLCLSHDFDATYNSKNIELAYGTNPGVLVYAGVPAQMGIANKFPDKDKRTIEAAINNIKKINPQKLVLISTISVYESTDGHDETSSIDSGNLPAYGLNRYAFETWVKENFSEALIVRLPALYGKGLKKNFIYDLIHFIPSMLNQKKYTELSAKDEIIKDYFFHEDTGYYVCKKLTDGEKKTLRDHFKELGFSALNFTDSRADFQFYNLKFLWEHINTAIKNDITLLNLTAEPVNASDLYRFITKDVFLNEIYEGYPNQNLKTIHFKIFNGKEGYLFDKEFVMNDIKSFIENEMR